jgi:hypothetical protein
MFAAQAQAVVPIPDSSSGYYPTPDGSYPAYGAKNILYLHGRANRDWPSAYIALPASAANGWYAGAVKHVDPSYNGSDFIDDAGTRNQIKQNVINACTGTSQCVIMCHSAGCYRALVALYDATMAGYSLAPTGISGVKFIMAASSAAGGTEAADLVTHGGFRLLWKVFGQYANVDENLKVGAARNLFAFAQNSAPSPMWHLAGSGNICKMLPKWVAVGIGLRFGDFWGFLASKVKLCLNRFLAGRSGDGAVPYHSACGYAQPGPYFACCDYPLGPNYYTNRVQENCSPTPYDHFANRDEYVANYAPLRMAGTPNPNIRRNSFPFADKACLGDADLTKDDADAADHSGKRSEDIQLAPGVYIGSEMRGYTCGSPAAPANCSANFYSWSGTPNGFGAAMVSAGEWAGTYQLDCEPVCGNLVCEIGETKTNCPSDCGPCAPTGSSCAVNSDCCGSAVCNMPTHTCYDCPRSPGAPCFNNSDCCPGQHCDNYAGNVCTY